MDYEIVGIVIVLVTLILAPAAVFLLRPVSKHAGELLKQMARERKEGRVPSDELERLRSSVESLSERLQLVEERQEFTESIIRGKDPEQPPALEERRSSAG